MRYYRKIIRIRAADSPNVRLALAQQAAGQTPTNEIVVPGVLTWGEYQKRRATWDVPRQTVGLDAEFFEGAAVLMFPPEWLNRAEALAEALRGKPRHAKAVGIDPAEGGDSTAMAAVDEYGLIELVSKKTPDTSVITGEAIAFGRRHNVHPSRWVFDRGGGGKEHADRLRSQDYDVQTVAFGEPPTMTPKRGLVLIEEKLEHREERYAYKNRRAEMYGKLRELLDPAREASVPRDDLGRRREPVTGFAIPAEYAELRRQLAPIPLTYDGEGRLYLLPKTKRSAADKRPTLSDLIGCSPDEADSVVLAIHGMTAKPKRAKAGAV